MTCFRVLNGLILNLSLNILFYNLNLQINSYFKNIRELAGTTQHYMDQYFSYCGKIQVVH